MPNLARNGGLSRPLRVVAVDEQHVIRLKVGQHARQVARLVEHGPAGDFESHPQLVGDDV